jgi:Zn-dependent protease with chaperone function
VVASFCLAGALAWALGAAYVGAPLRIPGEVLGAIAAVVAVTVITVSAWRVWRLADGGPAIAELLGARQVEPGNCTATERRLLNVVEEMAIASGIAVPPVYALDREDGINALVAGYSPNEAVIVVTRGAMTKLSRDELQGVMGHEFSHILNGDMALNVRLAGILAGLSWIGEQGEALVYRAAWQAKGVPREERNPDVMGAMFGALAAFIGFPGTLAADAIKAAISRSRELLADAASVQFTRNPDGIAGALDSILVLRAHTAVLAAHAAGLSHMFFAPAVSRWWGFPTHPPIEDRIRRAHPRFLREAYRATRHGTRYEVAVLDGGGNIVKHVRTLGSAVALVGTVGRPTGEHVDHAARLLERLPPGLREALHRADGAEAAMFALALEPEVATRRAELAALEARRGAPCAGSAADMYRHTSALARNHMLTLAELAIPAIKAQSQKERDRFLADLAAVVEADRRVTLREFVLLTFLRQRLREGAGHPIPTKFRTVEEVRSEAHAVLSIVAAAARDGAQAAFAKGAAVLKLGLVAPLGADSLTTAKVAESLERLRHLAPFAKPAVLKACLAAAAADGAFRLAEAELVRMVAATLDCPLPPVLAAQDPGTLAA